jgi:hypothetical protein
MILWTGRCCRVVYIDEMGVLQKLLKLQNIVQCRELLVDS